MTASKLTRVLYLVICAAPPVLKISELVGLLQEQGWTVCLVATPRAASWIDCGALAEQTGYPVRHDYEQDPLPKADLVVVVPATFNTINKWVMGINDSFALGLLNEVFGQRLPVVVVPYAKPTLAAHPVFARNLGALGEWGVMVLANEAIRVERDVFEWRVVVEACAGFLGAT